MAKKVVNDKEWFHHDYGTRNKTKLAVLIVNEGTKGYGLFWIIVEMLYEAREKCLELHDHSYIAVKKETGLPVDEINGFIERCINQYQVFKVHKKRFFTTERVLENEKVRKETSEAAKQKGIKSGESRRNKRTTVQQQFNNSSTDVEPNGTKESREKERKVEESINGATAHSLVDSNLYRQPKVPTIQEVQEAFMNAGGTVEMAQAFYRKYEATEWYLNNSPITNFRPLAQKFIVNWKGNENKGPVTKQMVM